MVVCRSYYDKISSEKLAWDKNDLTNVIPVFGPSSKRISAFEVGVAIGKMKQDKSAEHVQRELCQRCSRLQTKLAHCG